MTIIQERVQLLVDALRSEEFKQGREWLRVGDRYCCLGVACEVAIRNGLEVEVEGNPGGTFKYDGCPDFLPAAVRDWFGFAHRDPLIAQVPEAIHENCTGCALCKEETVYASRANDGLWWGFLDIAKGFEDQYLRKADSNGSEG